MEAEAEALKHRKIGRGLPALYLISGQQLMAVARKQEGP